MSTFHGDYWVEYSNEKSTITWPEGSPEALRQQQPTIAVTRAQLDQLLDDALEIGRSLAAYNRTRWKQNRIDQLERADSV